jgi:integrase
LSFFEWAMEYGHVVEPISVVLKRRVRVSGTNSLRPHSWLNEHEVRALLASCDETPRGRRDHALLGLGLLCGLRLEELRTLRWSGVNVEARMIALVGKGAKPAYVGLSEQFARFLVDWMRLCSSNAGTTFGSCPVVPRGWYGGGPTTHTEGVYHIDWVRPMSRSTVEKTVRMRGALIGHPELAPHDLRRSCAGLLEAKGVPIQDISRFLRHSNVAVTQRYLMESPYKVVETATMLAGLG